MNRWTLGPRFSAYLSLNYRTIKSAYIGAAIYCMLYGALYARTYFHDLIQFLWLFLGFSLAASLIGGQQLFKEYISDDSAMFYNSIPVTAFENVMAKTIVMGTSAWIPLIIIGNLFLVGFFFSEEKWLIFVTQMWNLGFTRQNLLASLLLLLWIMAVLGFVLGGASLLAWLLVNRTLQRKKLFMSVVYVLLTAVMLAAAAGLLWLVWLMAFVPVLVRLLLIMAAAIAMSVLLVRLNLAALEKWYCI